MALVIQTTGLENYAPGGEARIKVLNIGGPGVGKTRWASYFPKPIYADCEAGLASVADRRVPFVAVRTSQDMLDLLNHVKMDGRLPKDKRTIETVVIDTLDAYQRKLKAEWMDAKRVEAFTGWEAWGWLGQKMNLLLTRLLNLDVNVVVNVHYKDRVTKDDETGKESHELMLQLSGEISDTAFNDFDLVGWTGVYWAAEGGERVQKRGITFKPTPDKPMLKDRLHVTPEWLPIEFAPSDYEALFSRITAKVGELAPSETVGQIETAVDGAESAIPAVPPASVASGAVNAATAIAATEVPLAQLDKPTIQKRARDLGVTTLADGSPIKGNTTKAELIAAIEHHQKNGAPAQAQTPVSAADSPTAEPAPAPAPETKPAEAAAPSQPPAVEEVAEGLVNVDTGELVDDPESEEEPESDGPPAVLEAAPAATQPEPTVEEAVATVAKTLGGTVVEETPAATAALDRQRAAAKAAEPVAAKPSAACEDCGKDLAEEDQNYVKLGWIKYRKKICQNDYLKRKAG